MVDDEPVVLCSGGLKSTVFFFEPNGSLLMTVNRSCCKEFIANEQGLMLVHIQKRRCLQFQ